jgi:rhodanese-related sulfurtransferase
MRTLKGKSYGHEYEVDLYTEIIDGLYIGGYDELGRPPEEARSFISLTGQKYAVEYDNYFLFNLTDGKEIPERKINFIADCGYLLLKEGPVFIYCQYGLNRSALIAFLILRKLGYSKAEALNLLKKRHEKVLHNPYFRNYINGL